MMCKHNNPRCSFNVTKLKFPNFNLPAKKTCPYKTLACESYCYADKGRFVWNKALIKMYADNFEATKCSCFVEYMTHEIKRLRTLVFRIHASGDFYSNKYFLKWIEIIKNNPQTKFYTYTRNYTLDLSDLPDNFIVYYSMDHTTEVISDTAVRFAKILNVDKDTVTHLETYKEGVICKSDDCADCGHCFTEATNVYFPQKYKKYQVDLITV